MYYRQRASKSRSDLCKYMYNRQRASTFKSRKFLGRITAGTRGRVQVHELT